MLLEGAETEDEDLRARMIQGMHDTNTTRYISAIGLVLLLYDHFLTFPDEVEFVWRARPNFAKKIFLLNRYIVAISQICIAVSMNHFTNDPLPDKACKTMISIAFVVGVCSIACGNVLVILRVVTLWDRNPYVARFMALGFCASFCSTISFMIVVLRHAYPGFAYVAYAHMCVSTIKSPVLPGVWASSLVFEVLVLSFVTYNALSRPRDRGTPLRDVLYRDGMLFFACLSSLRTANLVISIIARPTLTMSGVFFIWAMTTLVLSRSLLNIHKVSNESSHARMPSRGTYNSELESNLALTDTNASSNVSGYPADGSRPTFELIDQKWSRRNTQEG
ncbi:hypothetical protein ACEPAH_6448 [Sanghuangporus vaninii]